jgi:hypothetical protein
MEMKVLKKELKDRKNRELIKLYLIAITDLVKGDNLMNQIGQTLRASLTDLNGGRIDAMIVII